MISDFAKEKVFWTRKMNLKLVKYIQSKPNIWNPKHPKYTSVECRDQTYAEFAAKYGDEFTGQAVKDRWTNIRSTFSTYLRKLSANQMKEDGDEYRVKWHLWEPCQFLMKVNRRMKADSSTISTDNYDNSNGDEKNEINLYQDKNEENDWPSEDNLTNENSTASGGTDCTSVVDNLVNVFKGVQNDAFGLDNTTNGKIGRAINRKLSKMNSYDAAKMSQKIMDILLLYNEQNPDNPNTIKSECF